MLRARLTLEWLEGRALPTIVANPVGPPPPEPTGPTGAASEPNDSLSQANAIPAVGLTTGSLLATDNVDFFAISLPQSGRLVAQVHADASLRTQLTLFDVNGAMLVQSDGQSALDTDDLIDQFLEIPAGSQTMYLEVQALAGAGTYTLATNFLAQPFPFPAIVPNPVGAGPEALVQADFNGDGRLDLATANAAGGSVSVLLGNGDGSFQAATTIPLGKAPTALVVGDFNRDGRPDLAVADAGSNSVVILLGDGDGSFRIGQTLAVGTRPSALVTGDFTGNGILDLAAADTGSDEVTTLLGNGEGSFRLSQTLAVGLEPTALVAGAFRPGHAPDLAVADTGSNDVSILLNNGDGSFRAAGTYAVESAPVAVVAGHFTHSGFLDLAVANRAGNPDGSNDGSVSVLLGNGDGSFQPQMEFVAGRSPVALAIGDFNADGISDLAVAESGFGDLRLLSGVGDGTFQDLLSRTVGSAPAALAVGDFNGDGTPDLAVADTTAGSVQVLLDRDPQAPVPDLADPVVGTTVESTPLFADVNGDGVNDSIAVNRDGQILLRLGRPGQPGAFAPAVPVNPLSRPARAVTTFREGDRTLIAAVDQHGDTVSLYAISPTGVATLTGTLATDPGGIASRIVAGHFRGVSDGFDDLAVLNALSRRISIYLSDGQGGFLPPLTTDLGGNGPFELAVADISGSGADDLLITNQLAGDVSVLLNNGNGQNFTLERFRAGAGPVGLQADGFTAIAPEGTTGVVAGHFLGGTAIDLVVANAWSHTLAVLPGDGFGGFLNPVVLPLDFSPTLLAAGAFVGAADEGANDIAVLDATTQVLHIFLSDGHGSLIEKVASAPLLAGNAPSGLAVHDVNGDGLADLQVGNAFGDVLTLLGNGDGTFRPFLRIDQNIALGVADAQHFLLSNQSRDRVVEQQGLGGPVHLVQDRSGGILAPGQTRIATVAGVQYAVVANSGANSVLVYPLINGIPDVTRRQTYFVGADPVAITVVDVNGDRVPDVVVADYGSNDVTVLLGQAGAAGWSLTPGPRLQTGGIGPVSTVVEDVNGDGLPDILVSNQVSGTVALLPGVGGGFFNDQNPLIRAAGDLPGTLLGTGNGVVRSTPALMT
jgi:hypothetical protein